MELKDDGCHFGYTSIDPITFFFSVCRKDLHNFHRGLCLLMTSIFSCRKWLGGLSSFLFTNEIETRRWTGVTRHSRYFVVLILHFWKCTQTLGGNVVIDPCLVEFIMNELLVEEKSQPPDVKSTSFIISSYCVSQQIL